MTRFCVPIVSGNDRFGYLWVLDPEHSLSEHGQSLARQAGRDLLAVLDRRRAALRAEESSIQALIARLLCGTAESFEQILPELQQREIAQPDSRLSVFAFEPESGGPRNPVERTLSLRQRLAATEPSHRWFTLAGKPTAIVAVSRPDTRPDRERVSAAVANALDYTYDERPALGWSGDRVPISDAAQAFRHARLALTLAQVGAVDEAVAIWTDLGSWKTIALLAERYSSTPGDLAKLVHPGIVGLIEKGRGDLIHTLDVFLAHRGDARKTAEALHLHRSTLYYRLEKITEEVGGDLGDGEVRFELMLSIRLAYFARLYRRAPSQAPTAV